MKKSVTIWLWAGIIMVLIQVMIGGITRLTNSGLSITEWNVIKGTIPPLNDTDWNIAFDKYKTFANKQFSSIHADMNMSEFKKIYFWEYFHRLWARLISFVFIFPFLFFLWKKHLSSKVIKWLLIAVMLAAVEAVFGWVMVSSGLNEDNRTWVSAYKLMVHLITATALFGVLIYTYLVFRDEHIPLVRTTNPKNKKMLMWILVVVIIQFSLGALMAGMRAGLIHPYMSILIHFDSFKTLLSGAINADALMNYEASSSIKAVVQLFHRVTAWVILGLISYYYYNSQKAHLASRYLFMMVIAQVILGIITVSQCVGSIPLVWGILHQVFALLLFGVLIWNQFLHSAVKKVNI
jgi:heme a synthase